MPLRSRPTTTPRPPAAPHAVSRPVGAVRRTTAVLTLAATALGAAALAPPVASAASAVAVGGCSLPRDAGLETLLAAHPAPATLVVGPQDMARARQLEAAATPAMSSEPGLRTRQQLRQAAAALAAPLPSPTSVSLGARASAQRMLTLRYAAEVAADGTSPALAPGATTTPSSTYERRIRDEVLRWAAMPSWGALGEVTAEDSLLEAAEAASTTALGYSLVRRSLTPSQRSAVRAALVTKGLEPLCHGYRGLSWQTEATHNYGVVVNAGAAMAALVVAESDERTAAAVLAQALPRVQRAVRTTAADGGSYEGPSYASLLQRYLALLTASVDLTLGDEGLARVPRVPGAARYLAAVTGPSGRTYAYGNSTDAPVTPWLPLWEARHGGDPLGDELGRRLLAANNPDTLLLLWSRPTSAAVSLAQEPLDLDLPTSGVAVMRSDWGPRATWVGVKAGDNAVGHSHLDLGSFSLEVGGRRFVEDTGKDSYALPGYLSGPRMYDYWRRSTAGHSTLSRGGANQPLDATAALAGPAPVGGGTRQVSVDMADALSALTATRRVRLLGTTATVQDTVRLRSATTLRWSAQTRAAVALERRGRSAVLTLDGQQVEARLGSSTPGAFRVVAAPAAPEGGVATTGLRTLVVDVPTRPGRLRTSTANVVVTFLPR